MQNIHKILKKMKILYNAYKIKYFMQIKKFINLRKKIYNRREKSKI